jgi:hypothetical protein
MGTSTRAADESVVTEILREATDLIRTFGWEHGGYSLHGAAKRCIRKAVWDAATGLAPRAPEPHVALQRISEAIYGRRGCVGGINDYEYRKTTDKAAVIAMLDKAIQLGPVKA